jgi:hypothetical protein
MRGAIVRPEIRLDLHDPADPSPCRVVAHQARTDEGPAGIKGRTGQERSVDDAQRKG